MRLQSMHQKTTLKQIVRQKIEENIQSLLYQLRMASAQVSV